MGKRNIYTQKVYICVFFEIEVQIYLYICRCIFSIIHACSIINWYWCQHPLKNKTLHVHIASRKHYDHGWRHGWIKYCICCSHCVGICLEVLVRNFHRDCCTLRYIARARRCVLQSVWKFCALLRWWVLPCPCYTLFLEGLTQGWWIFNGYSCTSHVSLGTAAVPMLRTLFYLWRILRIVLLHMLFRTQYVGSDAVWIING